MFRTSIFANNSSYRSEANNQFSILVKGFLIKPVSAPIVPAGRRERKTCLSEAKGVV
jgi:hypothetical protein